MEKQSTKRITRRFVGQLKIGDWVVILKEDRDRFLYRDWIYKIFNKAHLAYLEKYCGCRKATKQEYIVAKLKGKLYE